MEMLQGNPATGKGEARIDRPPSPPPPPLCPALPGAVGSWVWGWQGAEEGASPQFPPAMMPLAGSLHPGEGSRERGCCSAGRDVEGVLALPRASLFEQVSGPVRGDVGAFSALVGLDRLLFKEGDVSKLPRWGCERGNPIPIVP